MRVLVTGGTGVLGRAVVLALQARTDPARSALDIPLRGVPTRSPDVRVFSRGGAPGDDNAPSPVEWATGDLVTGAGLDAALAGVAGVVHSATSPTDPAADVRATERLVAAARSAGVGHVVYVSIVGIDALGFAPYYAAKLAGERAVAAAGVPYSILRATQFHPYVASLLQRLWVGPRLVLPPHVTLQPVDVDAVAARLAAAALGLPAAGHLPDVAGPGILSLERLTQTWLAAAGREPHARSVPLPLATIRALQSGQLTAPSAERIGPPWAAWLAAHATAPNPYARARASQAHGGAHGSDA